MLAARSRERPFGEMRRQKKGPEGPFFSLRE
jgi:hypothetical protein